MTDREMAQETTADSLINNQVIGLSPSVSLGSNMLSLAASMGRDYANATNQQQLNYIMAMTAAMQNVGDARTGAAIASTQAMDLFKVFAAVQAR